MKIVATFGNVSIRDENDTNEHGDKYTVFVEHGDGDYDMASIRCFDLDHAVLFALELKHEGTNGGFSTYAALMLEIEGELWVTS